MKNKYDLYLYFTKIFLTIKTLISIKPNLECRKGILGQSKHCVIPETSDRVTGRRIGGCKAGWKKTFNVIKVIFQKYIFQILQRFQFSKPLL